MSHCAHREEVITSSKGRFTVSGSGCGQAAVRLPAVSSFPFQAAGGKVWLSLCEPSDSVTQQLADNRGHGKWRDPAQT